MGNINSSNCYELCDVVWACCDGAGGVTLSAITSINGLPPDASGGGTPPGAPNASVQWNNNGLFGGSPNFVWDNVNSQLNVTGYVNSSHCYLVNNVPFACYDTVSGGIDLSNITNINGLPAGNASVTVSDTPPANPAQGNLWFDSADTQLYIWYQDPNSGQWVATINQCGLIGDAPSNNNIYGRQNGTWTQITSGGGGSQTPWLSNIDGAGYTLNNPGLIGINQVNVFSGWDGRLCITETTRHPMIHLVGGRPNNDNYCTIVFSGMASGSPALLWEVGTDPNEFGNGDFQIGIRGAGRNGLFCLQYDTGYVGLGEQYPAYPLDVNGDVNTSTQYNVNGIPQPLLIKVPISTSDLLNLGTTPKVLLPAPGVGKTNLVLGFMFEMLPGTTPFAGTVSPELLYSDFSNLSINGIDPAIIRGTTRGMYQLGMPTNQVYCPENLAVVLQGSNFTGGNGSAIAWIFYVIITL